MTIVIALKGARYSGDRWSRARAFISLVAPAETLSAAKKRCGALA